MLSQKPPSSLQMASAVGREFSDVYICLASLIKYGLISFIYKSNSNLLISSLTSAFVFDDLLHFPLKGHLIFSELSESNASAK